MTQNQTLGITTVKMGGKSYKMRFTWAELSELETKYGINGPQLGNTDDLAFTASVGMRAFHPDMTPERIKELSPPFFSFNGAVALALRWAYWGADDPDVVAAITGNTKKKFRPFKKLSRWLSGAASRRANSGD